MALVLTLILVGSLVLLFGSFAMAYWLGNLTGSTTLGFGIIAAVLVLIAVVVYANRMSWIVLPTTRFMVSLLASSLAVPSQEGIAMEKAHLSEQLDANQRDMKNTATSLLAPPPVGHGCEPLPERNEHLQGHSAGSQRHRGAALSVQAGSPQEKVSPPSESDISKKRAEGAGGLSVSMLRISPAAFAFFATI